MTTAGAAPDPSSSTSRFMSKLAQFESLPSWESAASLGEPLVDRSVTDEEFQLELNELNGAGGEPDPTMLESLEQRAQPDHFFVADGGTVVYRGPGDVEYAGPWTEPGRGQQWVQSGDTTHLHEPGVSARAHVDPSATVHPTARIEADAHIGPNATVGEWAHVGRKATVADSANIDAGAVVGPMSNIDKGAHVGRGTTIGAGASVGERAEIGAGADIGEGAKLGDQARVRAGGHVPAGGGAQKAQSLAGHLQRLLELNDYAR